MEISTWANLNLIPVIPEICLAVSILVILMADAFASKARHCLTYGLTLLAILVTLVAQVLVFTTEPVLTFENMFVADALASVVKIIMYIVTAVILIYSRQYLKDRQLYKGEYFALSLFALLGMNIMASATHFLTLYMGLELMSLALYALIALQRDSVKATEAAMKYFVLGALASGLLLYGFSMIYGATGSLALDGVILSVYRGTANMTLIYFGLVFVVAGLAFKLGAVPFHMWLPDVYHGAPTTATLMIGAAPKLAAFVFIVRILVQGLDMTIGQWHVMLIILAVLSMALGNIAAILQTNIKRMFAYSTISHMGFILMGLLSGTALGYASALFYTITYVLMTLVSFGVLIVLSRAGFECETLEDLKGLNSRSKWYAFLMLLAMFSMAGIPPLVGFYAKLTVIRSVVDVGFLSLAVFAVLMSVIGAFYYLRVIKVMYFDEAKDQTPFYITNDAKIVLSVNALLLLVLGILPEQLLVLCTGTMVESLKSFL